MPPPDRRITAASTIKKRSMPIDGHKTSFSLEDEFYEALKDIARSRRVTLTQMISEIDRGRGRANLSSAIRVTVLEEARAGRLPLAHKE